MIEYKDKKTPNLKKAKPGKQVVIIYLEGILQVRRRCIKGNGG